MKLPLAKPFIKKHLILEEIEKALDTKWISGGPTIGKFEEAIKKYNGDEKRYYIAVSNGTTAIEMALLYLNGGNTYEANEINEVIVPSWSWVASGFSVPRVKAKPVWCDVNKFGVPSVETIKPLITDNTAAIIVVHQMGIPCDMDAINELANEYNIPVIEDGACAFGSEYNGHKIGTNTKNIVTYSFQAKKVLTTGEGGMIVVSSKEAEKWLKSFRSFGTSITPLERDNSTQLNKEFFDKIGGNYKMSDINAAVGLAHLKYLDEEIKLRTEAANYYNERIKLLNISGFSIAIGNIIPDYCTKYNWQNYHIIIGKKYLRDVVVEKLKAKGIGCKWDIQATHSEPAINNRVILPNTDLFHKYGLQLPFFAEITREEQDFVIKSLKEVLDEFTIY